jgi:hypothetical protein
MAETSAWMPLYIGDYLSLTMDMTTEEHGALLLLIMAFHQTGSLPADERSLAAVARVTIRKWRSRVGGQVMRFFPISGSAVACPLIERWRYWTFGRLSQTEWNKIRKAIIDRDGTACSYCGADTGNPTVDHIIALARGGTNDFSNLTVACKSCNSSKGAKSLEVWLQ